MINKLKKAITALSFGLVLAVPIMSYGAVSAQTDCINSSGGSIASCLNSGADKTDPDAASQGDATERVNKAIRLVINIFSFIVGVIAVIMIIVGGFKYITSGGESSNVGSAKNTILYAIIGLVVVALAQVVVKFVLQKVTQQ